MKSLQFLLVSLRMIGSTAVMAAPVLDPVQVLDPVLVLDQAAEDETTSSDPQQR